MSERHTCEKNVWGGYTTHKCMKTAKMQHKGVWYCGIHDPVQKAAKDAAREAKWQVEWAADKAKWAHSEARNALCEGVTTEELTRLGKGWLRRQIDGYPYDEEDV
jgi:hypothetical protein